MNLEALLPPKTWRDYLVNEEPQESQVYVKIEETPVWSAESISLVVGKKKVRKTLFLTWLIRQYEGDITADILLADTEQGTRRSWKMRKKIFDLTGKWMNVLDLRGLNTEERRNKVEEAIKEGNFKIVIIDGIRDLLSNINSEDQSTALVTWIEQMMAFYGVHICAILHLNKGNDEARGHIGSELENKAEIIIGLEKHKSGVSIVHCRESRDIPFDSFAFTHGITGLPELANIPVNGEVVSDQDQKKKLAAIFDGQLLKHSQVIEGICDYFKVGKNKAGQLLATFMFEKHWIVKEGPNRSPSARYKLMVDS